MRIYGIYIDGFGIYHNQTVNNIPGGLVLFTGKNEDGKTTLMEFIRTILFGSLKSKNNYEPLRGGSHGGRLRLIMNDNQVITIERKGKKVSIGWQDGTSEQIEPSEKLMMGINRKIFENIFAIGLSDMEGLGVLSDEGVRGRILSASAGIGAKSIPDMINNIDNELSNLLKSGRATNPKINQIVRNLRNIRSEIKDLQEKSANYSESQRKLEELEYQINENQKKILSMRQRLDRIKRLEQARKTWIEKIEAKKELDNLEFAKDFPPKGLERFEKLKEDIDNYNNEKSDLESKANQLETRLHDIIIDEKIIKNRMLIENLGRERQKFISAIEDLPIVESKYKQEETDFRKQLKELGRDWDSQKLKGIDISVQTRHKVQDFDRRMDSAERIYEQARSKLQSEQNNEKVLKTKLEETKKAQESFVKPSIIDKDEVKRKRETAKKIRSLLYKLDNLNTQLDTENQSIQRENDYITYLNSQIPQRKFPQWVWFAGIFVGVILLILFIIMKSYTIGVLIFLFSIIVSVALWVIRDQQLKTEKKVLNEIKDHKDNIEKLLYKINTIKSEIDEKTKEINEYVHNIDKESLNDIDEVDEFEAELDQVEEALRNWDSVKQKKDDAEKSYQEAEENLKNAIKTMESSEEELQKIKEEWRQWITEKGFDDTISPKGFETIIQMVEKARSMERSLTETEFRVKQMKEYIAQVREEIRKVLQACSIDQDLSNVGVSEMDVLEKALNTALEDQKKKDDLSQKLEDTKESIRKLTNRIAERQRELNELMRKANASNEDEFRKLAESYNAWIEKKRIYETNCRSLMNIAGNEEAVKSLESELSITDSSTLASEEMELRKNLEDIEAQMLKDSKEMGQLSSEINQMLQNERLNELLFEQKMMEEQLSELVKRWATLIVLDSLIKHAREKYERERQPKIIQEASDYMKIMTGKNYRLIMPTGESSIKIEDEDTMERKDEITWSAGLADQVYLAVRFGLAHVFSEHSEPLPLILDDVLVRFDPDRQLGAAKVIINMAKNHQIFIFSCHPSIRDIIDSAYLETGLSNSVPFAHYKIDNGTIIKI